MGLDFSPGCASWSYSGFHRFRTRLAAEIGVYLDEMEGFGGGKSWDDIHDAIVPLLAHSDCDGHLSPKVCATVAPRLQELVANWDDDDPEYWYDKKQALGLADGMLECAKKNQRLVFC